MYTSEDVNTSALYNLHYTGAAKQTKDSQEQYEALLAKWGVTHSQYHSESLTTKVSKSFKKAVFATKSLFSFVKAAPVLGKQHSGAHL
ncbi:hypothetical protein [Marinomonas ostreistagni]|uniref:Uncharacterized protein n=1 Tax=Marinomonas ostreistagni TaxID=359209 RepID=A0ABS0ZFP3_9GAMM|nr:hypothetical protein [Marinomonas ostreistagni]MBJ7552492.1 hypothetical protein [Marinomonas ostreistagni]